MVAVLSWEPIGIRKIQIHALSNKNLKALGKCIKKNNKIHQNSSQYMYLDVFFNYNGRPSQYCHQVGVGPNKTWTGQQSSSALLAFFICKAILLSTGGVVLCVCMRRYCAGEETIKKGDLRKCKPCLRNLSTKKKRKGTQSSGSPRKKKKQFYFLKKTYLLPQCKKRKVLCTQQICHPDDDFFLFFFFLHTVSGRSLSPSFFPDRGEMPKTLKFLLFY